MRHSEVGSDCSSAECARSYLTISGIRNLLLHEEAGTEAVTEQVRDFYERHPFPAYDGVDDRPKLLSRATPDSFAHDLDKSLPLSAIVVELGCGTGQLTNFLAMTGRKVLGVDLSMSSLIQAERFRRRQGIASAQFAQMNIFRPAISKSAADVVVSMGVLHHTADPARGIAIASSLLKPGGYMIVGLYHRYARLGHGLRRKLFEHLGPVALRLDPVLARANENDRAEAWLADQYHHPHETTHTARQVISWFKNADLQFVRTVPDFCSVGPRHRPSELLTPAGRYHGLKGPLSEMSQALHRNADGGLFVSIARKPLESEERLMSPPKAAA